MGFSVTKAGRIAALVVAASLVWGCSGDDGAPGTSGNPGPSGPPGPPGPPGTPPDAPIVIGDGSALTADEIERLGKLYATITSVTIASPPVVEFTLFDEQGYPAEGVDPGVVLFTFAKLMPPDPDVNGGLATWQSYINRTATSDRPGGIGTAVQATNDRGGELEYLGDEPESRPGTYRYTFSNDVTNITSPVAVAWEPNLTHRVGLEIRLSGPGEVPLAPFNPVYDFVPDGGPGTGTTKIIADTENCADCHFEFALHGGPRKSVDYCVTCHNPGSVDPDTGESVDMAYLAHSIHKGENRVDAAGNPKPYIIYGFGGTPHDYGHVTYPQSLTYCETCHTASESYPDGDAWNEGASAKTCGGCHADGLVAENYDAVTGQADYFFDHAVAEVDIGIIADGECAGCHLGAIDSAGPALAIHSVIRGDDRVRAASGDNFVFEILGAENTGPGQVPTVTFRITNPQGVAYDIVADDEFTNSNASLNLYVQWSTGDYYGGDENGLVLGAEQRDDLSVRDVQSLNLADAGYPYRMRIGAIRDAIVNGDGTANADGSYTVPFFRALPDAISGDVAIGLAGHPAWEYTDQDGVTAFDRAAAISAVYYPGTPREAAFDSAQCNACHERLQFHGGNRNGNYEICLLCHNADTAVCSSNPAADGSCPDGETQEGFHFGRMIHSIHAASTTYEGGSFAGVTFPQPVANCDACHKPGAYNVARPTARAVSTNQGNDVRVWTDDIATTPTVAACSICHNSSAALGHYDTQGAQRDTLKCSIVGAACGAMDGSSGSGLPNGQESCAVCHGTGREFETSQYHNPGVEE
jgi:OmcA/MtrC family decaheme c-type cytochrome